MYYVASKNKLKEISKLKQKKYRDDLGLFIAEGSKIIEDIIANKIDICEVFILDSFDILKKFDIAAPIYAVDKEQMKKISTTDSPANILVVAKKPSINTDIFRKLNKIILLDSISDPGNLGTIIRSAVAFGIQGIILFSDCVDIYSPKVIRSTAGNFFKIPIINLKSKEELQKYFKDYVKISTSVSSGNSISLAECKMLKKFIIMFGSEATGLSDFLYEIADKNIQLEMKNNVESLNLAVCASIIMYSIQK